MNVTHETIKKHRKSKHKPNAELVDIKINQQDEWRSWWLSNSSVMTLCAFRALIVGNPCIVAARWVKIGERAVEIY